MNDPFTVLSSILVLYQSIASTEVIKKTFVCSQHKEQCQPARRNEFHQIKNRSPKTLTTRLPGGKDPFEKRFLDSLASMVGKIFFGRYYHNL
jgi:hypothetical protein